MTALPNPDSIPADSSPDTSTSPLLSMTTSVPPAPMPTEASPETTTDPELSTRSPSPSHIMPSAASPSAWIAPLLKTVRSFPLPMMPKLAIPEAAMVPLFSIHAPAPAARMPAEPSPVAIIEPLLTITASSPCEFTSAALFPDVATDPSLVRFWLELNICTASPLVVSIEPPARTVPVSPAPVIVCGPATWPAPTSKLWASTGCGPNAVAARTETTATVDTRDLGIFAFPANQVRDRHFADIGESPQASNQAHLQPPSVGCQAVRHSCRLTVKTKEGTPLHTRKTGFATEPQGSCVIQPSMVA